MTADGAGDWLASEPRRTGNVIAPDSVGTWRLRKAISLQDARWYLDHGSRDAASTCVKGARYANREIVRIKRYVRENKFLTDSHPPAGSPPAVPAAAGFSSVAA